MTPTNLLGRLGRASLGVQLAIVLTAAQLPIGVIALFQASDALRETRRLAETALIGKATRAALYEFEILSDSLASARALGQQVFTQRDEIRPDCDRVVSEFIEEAQIYIFAGIISADGLLVCGSDGVGRDLSHRPVVRALIETNEAQLGVISEGAITGRNVIAAGRPIVRNGKVQGYATLSMPIEVLRFAARRGEVLPEFHLALIDGKGKVAATNGPDLGHAPDWLPHHVDFSLLEGKDDASFRAVSRDGRDRTFAIAPIFNKQFYLLAADGVDPSQQTAIRTYLAVFIFPLAMWAVGLLFSLLVINRYAVVPIGRLREMMRAFEQGRRDVDTRSLYFAPEELRELGDGFARLTATVTHDEVLQRMALQEKNTLLREVYHRVKNNLQLILSMMSMQMRNARDPHARAEFARLQNRVRSLATVHQKLYETPSLHNARTDIFLSEVVRNVLSAGTPHGKDPTAHIDIDRILLTPDSAVTLSLYAGEAITNALKHTGREPGRIAVRLKQHGTIARLEVENSVGTPDPESETISGGLGQRLMSAFAMQLGGKESVEQSETHFKLTLEFPIDTASPETSEPAP